MSNRFQRNEMLIGKRNTHRLNQSFVAVFGIGGVGSYAVEALVRSGVGHLYLVDHDTIDITNINRQIHALEETIGQLKVDAMSQRAKCINPHVQIDVHCEFITRDNIMSLINPAWDYVIDAVDTVTAKVALIAACKKHKIPVISAMGAAKRLSPQHFEVTDISKTHTCPLARAVRRTLRADDINSDVKVVYAPNPPLKPKYDLIPSQNQGKNTMKEKTPPASMIFAPATCGLLLASEVIKDLLIEQL